MLSFPTQLLSTDDWPPRWQCGQWSSFHAWLHIISDLLIFAAYMAIPVGLLYALRKNQSKGHEVSALLALFSAFIICCGLGHFCEAVIFWTPIYRLAGLVKLLTALASWATVLALLPMLPRLLQLPAMESQIQELTVEKDQEKQRAQQSLEQLADVVSQSKDAIITLSPDGLINSWNAGANQMYGYEASEVLGLSIAMLFPEGPSEHSYEAFNGLLQDSKLGHRETQRLKRDGQIIQVSESITVLQGGAKDTALISLINHDLSQRIRYEHELKASKEAAEAANQSKSAFLATISHELRTPLNAIIGMIHLLQKTPLKTSQADSIRKVNVAAHDLLHLINEILDFSKIESGELSLEIIDFSVESLCSHVTQLMSQKFRNKLLESELEFILELDPALPSLLRGDSLRLQQVLLNLVNNALKFTDRGEVVLSLKIAEELGQDLALQFSVKDSGIGISEDQQQSIFKAFKQADPSTTRLYGGTGLGLSICHSLVELMGGRIWVESQLGQGSSFHVQVPLQRSHHDDDEPAAPEIPKIRSLVVVSQPRLRAVLEQQAQALGLAPTWAGSGEAALRLALEAEGKGQAFGRVLIDYRLPGMSGPETARRLKDTASARLSFIMFATEGREQLMLDTDRALYHKIVTKPITRGKLIKALQANAEPEPQTDDCTMPASLRQQLQGLRVLLVEDNDINHEITCGLLADAQPHIDWARNGEEAVQMVKAQRYDLVLMDIQMPGVDGITATQMIRALGQEYASPNLPIIAMTASVLASDRAQALESGMNDFVAKPIDPRALYTALSKQLGGPLSSPPVAEIKRLSVGQGLPKELPGFDLREGLQRCLGREQTYLRLLKKFRVNFETSADDIEQALGLEQVEQASQILHKLKGVCGNLAATQLYRSCQDLNKAMQRQSSDLQTQLADFKRQHALVMTSLKACFG